MSDPNEIVGHKTISTGKTDPATGFPIMRHEPLTKTEADALWKRAEESKEARARLMPTEQDAVRAMWQAYQRLRELGWKETMYRSDSSRGAQQIIEPGSSGIHVGHYDGEWPKGSWWAHSDGDLWPSSPCLAKDLPSATTSTTGVLK